MGISDSGCEDGDIANADYGAEKISQDLKDRMNKNLHYANLLISQEARYLAEEFKDPVWSRMKASNHLWARTVCSSTQAETMPDGELSSDDGTSPCSAHQGSDTRSFNFSAPPGGYSLKGIAILKELFSLLLPARFRLIKLHNCDTYSLVLTVRDGPARVLNSIISSRAAEEAQMSGTRLWTACALQLSSALQWPARRLFITGAEATVCLHVPVPLPFSNYESLRLSLPSLAEDNFPLHAQNAATGTLFVCHHYKSM
eukprot:2118907-Rhodomonas_salina.1